MTKNQQNARGGKAEEIGDELEETGKAKHSSLLPSPSTPDAMAIANFCNLGHLGGAAASSSQKLLLCDLQMIAGDLEGGRHQE